MIASFITFSDTAKYADLARNIVLNNGWGVHHSFFNQNITFSYHHGDLFNVNFYPITSLLYSLVFRVLPISDLTILYIGSSLYILSAFIIYLLGKKIFTHGVGLLASLIFLLQYQIYGYVRNCTTELVFIFLSVLFLYLFLSGKIKTIFAFLILPILLFTRLQSLIFLCSGLLTILLHVHHRISRSIYFLLVSTISIITVFYLFWAFQNQNQKFSIFSSFGTLNLPTNIAQGEYLRGKNYPNLSNTQVAKKTLYNIYNYAKSPDRIINPILLFALLISFLTKTTRIQKSFITFVFLNLSIFILAASATLPNARYIHPILPLVALCAAFGLASVVNITRPKWIFIVLAIGVLSIKPLGILMLDSRFESKLVNSNKPPAYFVIAEIMSKNIPKDRLIVTNLDAWASWYYGLTTMWFPLEPDQLIPPQDVKSKVDYIVMTNYKEEDGDFNLGPWREVVYSPENITNIYLHQNYTILKTFHINPIQVRENRNYQGTILVKKDIN